MTWSTTDIASNDIIQQDGIFAYNFTASGTIYKGQAVYICKNDSVGVCGSAAGDCNAIGLACINATNGVQISVACGGNIAVACANHAASAPTVGAPVYGYTDGTLYATIGNATKVAGYVVNNAASDVSGSVAATYRVIKVLLV
jgi:hypothetical protein